MLLKEIDLGDRTIHSDVGRVTKKTDEKGKSVCLRYSKLIVKKQNKKNGDLKTGSKQDFRDPTTLSRCFYTR